MRGMALVAIRLRPAVTHLRALSVSSPLLTSSSSCLELLTSQGERANQTHKLFLLFCASSILIPIYAIALEWPQVLCGTRDLVPPTADELHRQHACALVHWSTISRPCGATCTCTPGRPRSLPLQPPQRLPPSWLLPSPASPPPRKNRNLRHAVVAERSLAAAKKKAVGWKALCLLRLHLDLLRTTHSFFTLAFFVLFDYIIA